VGSEYTFVDPNSWVGDWDFSRDGFHLNRRRARYLGQLYSRVRGISGGREKMRGDLPCMAVGTSSEGTSGETGMAPIQAHTTAAYKMAESDEPTAKPERR
jgi:Golgi nucleoside diphosphatase